MSDAFVLSARCARLSRRNVEAMITALALPILLMLVFVELFGGAIDTGTSSDYVTYVAPGVALLCAGFGAASTAVAVSVDLTGGIVDRLRSMNVSGAALLGGHVAASVMRNAVATSLVFAVAIGLGFRPEADVLAWLGAIGILLAFVLALSWLSAAMGLLAGSPEAANGFTFFVMFLPYASSAFVPVDTMPSWLQGFAGHQPVTPVVDTLRGLLLDQPVGDAWWQALLWCAGIAAVSVVAAAALFGRRSAH
jgi:ABC-2 type transport system permease protein